MNHERSDLAVWLEGLALTGLLANLAMPLYYWSALPPKIPTHFGFRGTPDAWGPKESLWMVPLVSILLYTTMTWVPRHSERFNYPVKITPENRERQKKLAITFLQTVKAEVMMLFFYIVYQQIQVAMGSASSLGIYYLPIVLMTVFGTIGYYFYNAFQNR